jgi:uncharacterized protein
MHLPLPAKSSLSIALWGGILLFITACGPAKRKKTTLTPVVDTGNVETQEQPFVKEGELVFLPAADKDPSAKINIQIADDEQKRMKGLMYRKYMPDTIGMLFIFDRSEPQSFWMHNTVISLDILFVSETGEIVTIHRYTEPFSNKSLPSTKNALYVVEVVAGFCDKYKIREGNLIRVMNMHPRVDSTKHARIYLQRKTSTNTLLI